MGNHYHFFKMPHEVVDSDKFVAMRPSSQVLYMHLCRIANKYANQDSKFFRSINSLVKDTGLTRKTIIEAKKELIKNNFVDHERGKYTSTKLRSPDVFKINGFILNLSDS